MSFQTAPKIIKETCNGFSSFNINDEMFKRREIQCIGKINAESVNEIIMQLLYLEREDDTKEITIYINSPGGEISSGLALYDIMQAINSPIRTVCVGTAASMGAILFVAGNKRDILPHARVLIHDPLMYSLDGNALQIKNLSDNLMYTRETIGKILAKHTKKPLKEIYKKTAIDSYFYAEEAVKFGLADQIITTI